MEIKVSSKYDRETVKKFTYFIVFTRYKIGIIYLIWLLLRMLSTVLPVLPDIIDYSQKYGFSFDIICEPIMFYGFFAILWLLFIWLLPKIKYWNIKYRQNAENKYVFTDENIQFFQEAKGVNNSASIEYSAVSRVYETSEFFYVFLNTNKWAAYIIDKSTVTGGTAMDLRALLIKKIGANKYKVKCKE